MSNILDIGAVVCGSSSPSSLPASLGSPSGADGCGNIPPQRASSFSSFL